MKDRPVTCRPKSKAAWAAARKIAFNLIDSPRADYYNPRFLIDGQLAQSVEQGIENPRVRGSIPRLATIFESHPHSLIP